MANIKLKNGIILNPGEVVVGRIVEAEEDVNAIYCIIEVVIEDDKGNLVKVLSRTPMNFDPADTLETIKALAREHMKDYFPVEEAAKTKRNDLLGVEI